MNRKWTSWAALFLGAAFSFFLADQSARRIQTSQVYVSATSDSSCQHAGCNHSSCEDCNCSGCSCASMPASYCLPNGGLGAMIEAEPRGVRLVSVIPGGAASKAGLKLGDRIISIDGVSAVGQSADWMLWHLRGKLGTSVRVEVERGDGIWQRTFTIDVVREGIDASHSVYSRIHDGELVLKVLWFDENTATQLSSHLAQVSRGDVKSVVLDLQSASYGDARSMAECASLFLPPNTTVGYVVDLVSENKDVATSINTFGFAVTDLLTAVRVGPYTARVGEMLARALSHKLGVAVVGSPSAGLGALDSGLIRYRGSDEYSSVQLLDDQGRAIQGNPLRPSFWSWSNLLSPLPLGN